ncbi:MAG: hypothetical protein WCS31_11910 [Verrucomicrobiae bacterium]
MSLKTEIEGFCRHPQGYYYFQDASGNYFTPAQFLVLLPPEVLSARYGFRTTGGQREYWIYQQGFSSSKEEFIFRTFIPEGRLGWATDFEQTPASQTHYYGERNSAGLLVSLCGKHKRRDDDSALFLLHPPPGKMCKACLKESNKSVGKA